MAKIYKHRDRIYFHLADPAGWLFFGNIFGLAHGAYEGLVQELGFSSQEWFHHSEYAIPVRSTEATYRAPMAAGSTYEVQITVKDLRTSSFQLGYSFYIDEMLCAEVSTLHVFMDLKTRTKRAIPERIQKALASWK